MALSIQDLDVEKLKPGDEIIVPGEDFIFIFKELIFKEDRLSMRLVKTDKPAMAMPGDTVH